MDFVADAVVFVVDVVAASITAAIVAVDYARKTQILPKWSVPFVHCEIFYVSRDLNNLGKRTTH